MSFPAYSAYKDSGVEWLGEVPEHWKEMPFFSLVSERCESNAGMKQENLLSLSYGRIVNKDINSLDGLLPASFETYQVVHPGDIVFRLTDLQNDKRSLRSAIVRETGIITSAYLAGFCKGIFPEFANFLFRAYDSIKVFYSMGGGLRQSMNYSDMKWLPIFLPEWQEQAQIARFLDYETARIDALIEQQQRLIELLKEKRQAVISHAVTKGLDPTVPMKDSGVEWLGEVPAHWSLKPLKYICQFSGGGTPSKENPEYWDGNIPWVSPKDMKKFCITDTKDKITDKAIAESSTCLVQPDALLMVVRSGILQRTIPVAINEVPVSLNQDMKALRFGSKDIAKYIALLIKGNEKSLLLALCKQGATVESIEHEYLSNLVVPLPPGKEVRSILKGLREEELLFEKLERVASRSSRLLQEHRSALISAAVTGKIDVREWKPPVPESVQESQRGSQ